MSVKDKIKANKKKAAMKKAAPRIAAGGQIYDAKCIQCKITYRTEKELDTDGQGRCPLCQQERDTMNERIEAQVKSSSPRERIPSFDTMPGVVHNGIKFIPLRAFG